MDDRGPLFTGVHRPAKADRVVLCHVAAHDQDGIGVGKVLLEGGRPTPSEACPQTGDGGAMSYPGLVFDRRPAQGRNRRRLVDQLAFGRALDEGGIARLFNEGGDAVHRPLEWPVFPVIGVGRTISHRGHAVGVDDILIGCSALRAERALVDGRGWVPLDVNDALVFDVDQLTAADRAIGTDGGNRLVRTASALFLLNRFAGYRLAQRTPPTGVRYTRSPFHTGARYSRSAFHTGPRYYRGSLFSQYMDA